MTLSLFVNLIIVTSWNTFIATPREGVNGQQYKQIETSQQVKVIWFKKKKRQNKITTKRGAGGGGEMIIFKAFLP